MAVQTARHQSRSTRKQRTGPPPPKSDPSTHQTVAGTRTSIRIADRNLVSKPGGIRPSSVAGSARSTAGRTAQPFGVVNSVHRTEIRHALRRHPVRRSKTPRRGIRTILMICVAGIAAAVAFVAPALACTWPTPGGGSWPIHTTPPGACQGGSCIQLPTCRPGNCDNGVKPPVCNPGDCGNGTKTPTCNPGDCGHGTKTPTCAPGNCGKTPTCNPGDCGHGTKTPTCAPGNCGSVPTATPSRSGGGSGGGATVPPSDEPPTPTETATQPVPSATSSSDNGSLPVTGVNLLAVVGAAGSLLCTGIALFYVARRRRVTFTA